MKSAKEFFLIIASISFVIVIGAGTYEHVAAVPRWSAAPPVSLSMFQGPYGLNPGPFWRSIHPITLLLLIISLVLNWRNGRRGSLLITIGTYLGILVATFIYFVPELLSITETPIGTNIDTALQARSAQWETLSQVRLVIMIIAAVVLLSALTRPSIKSAKS